MHWWLRPCLGKENIEQSNKNSHVVSELAPIRPFYTHPVSQKSCLRDSNYMWPVRLVRTSSLFEENLGFGIGNQKLCKLNNRQTT